MPVAEVAAQAAAIDVEGFQHLDHPVRGDVLGQRPLDDVEVLLAGLQAIVDAVDEEGIGELGLQDAEGSRLELEVEAFTLHVFEPATAKVRIPVVPHPVLDGAGTEVALRSFAGNPFMA
jgi:hypothetical protein